jgi:hypothetical protein
MPHVSPSWPDRARWIAFLKFMALFYALFFPFYFGAGQIAAGTRETFGLYWPWERDIPIVPWMIWPYIDRKSTRLNSSHNSESRMPSSA